MIYLLKIMARLAKGDHVRYDNKIYEVVRCRKNSVQVRDQDFNLHWLPIAGVEQLTEQLTLPLFPEASETVRGEIDPNQKLSEVQRECLSNLAQTCDKDQLLEAIAILEGVLQEKYGDPLEPRLGYKKSYPNKAVRNWIEVKWIPRPRKDGTISECGPYYYLRRDRPINGRKSVYLGKEIPEHYQDLPVTGE